MTCSGVPGTKLVCTLPNDETVLAIAYDNQGRLLICSTGGAYVLDGEKLQKIEMGIESMINGGDFENFQLADDTKTYKGIDSNDLH